MNPKMTVKDAADLLGVTERWVNKQLKTFKLPTSRRDGRLFFEHTTAKSLFQFSFKPQTIIFHIVKGGTGKTSLAFEFSIRANLYGAKVLCIDMDQQGNLTQACQIDPEQSPVMVDILAEDYSLKHAIQTVHEGLDLIPSRIENSMLDEVIRLRKFSLNKVYAKPLENLKKEYDLIVIDCPPSLGQSVAALTLATDLVMVPVLPEKFSLSGLALTHQAIRELESKYKKTIHFSLILNKFEPKSKVSQKALKHLQESPIYHNQLLPNFIRFSEDFVQSIAKARSIFDSTKPSAAKQDLDWLTRHLLHLSDNEHLLEKSQDNIESLEALFA